MEANFAFGSQEGRGVTAAQWQPPELGHFRAAGAAVCQSRPRVLRGGVPFKSGYAKEPGT